MADEPQEFKIDIISDADTKGFEKSADAAQKLKITTEDLSDETKRSLGLLEPVEQGLKKGGEAAEESIPFFERLGLTHRSLHQSLHLIATTAGPAAGAAAAAAGVATGGGIMIGIMAVHELLEAYNQLEEAAKKAAEEVRTAFVETMTEGDTARDDIDKLTDSTNKFFDALNRTTGLKQVQDDFAAELEQIKQIAAASEKAGLINKDQADEFVEKRTRDTQEKRALGLDSSIESLTQQKDEIIKQLNAPASFKLHVDQEAVKDDLKNLDDAYKNGGMYRPKSSAKNQIGVLEDDSLSNPENDALRKRNYEQMRAALVEMTHGDKKDNTKLEEHLALLEQTISRMTGESQKLKNDVQKTRASDTEKDFAGGKAIADRAKFNPLTNHSGENLSQNDQQYVILLEQAITGKKQTLDSAINLIRMQSANNDTALQMLTMHENQIAVMDTKLKQLLQQSTAGQRPGAR